MNRERALWTLCAATAHSTNLFPVFIEDLQDTNARIRGIALTTLIQYGRSAASLIAKIQPLTGDPNRDVRRAATNCLEAISGGRDQKPDGRTSVTGSFVNQNLSVGEALKLYAAISKTQIEMAAGILTNGPGASRITLNTFGNVNGDELLQLMRESFLEQASLNLESTADGRTLVKPARR